MVVVEAAVGEAVEGVATVVAVEQEVEVKVEAVAVDHTVDKPCHLHYIIPIFSHKRIFLI